MNTRERQRKNICEKAARKRRGKERRFNYPLRVFIERKYPKIFNEYVELFNNMDSKTPDKRDLTTSKFFKEWVAENSALESTEPVVDIVGMAFQETIAPSSDTAKIYQEPLPEAALNTPPIPQEPLPEAALITPPISQELLLEINRVNEIVNELWDDDFLRSVLGQDNVSTNEDEGIEILNKFDEVQFDVEPFDFNEEVDPFDF